MGKPTGFIEFTRELPGKRSAKDRVNDYNEFVERLPEEKLNQQSARCMNCGVPFCHSGCPLGNIIPEFTGRICPAPCESSCVLGINQPPVTIEEIEKHIIEIAFDKGFVKPRKPNVRTGKKVAVVGSGPAGLAAAAQLNYAGHTVTVFERDDKPGGLLRYGIPDFKLEKWVIDRRIKLMEEEGVTFRCHANVGVNVNVNDLLREYHAIVLAGGSTVPRDLNIPGRELKGVHYAMEFLKQQNKRNANLDPFANPTIESNIYPTDILANNKNVVVIGGGDTGSDCVGTSNRHKAKSVTQFELLPKPPVERNETMPWPNWPMILRTSTSHEEGCDRNWGIFTKEFIGDEHGNLKGLKIAEMGWSKPEPGKLPKYQEVPGTERVLPCELALLAIG